MGTLKLCAGESLHRDIIVSDGPGLQEELYKQCLA